MTASSPAPKPVPLPQAFLGLPLAHRALHDATKGVIENSPSAVRAAVNSGYGIEIDVQLSADGQAMVFHDDVVDRLTWRKGAVHRYPASVLGMMPLRGGRDMIQTLPAILKLVTGRVPLLIELKDQGLRDTGQLEHATATALAGYGGPVAVMSFNPKMVGRMAKLAPSVPRGLTTQSYGPDEDLPSEVRDHLRAIADVEAVGASFISHEAADLDRPRVAELKAAGLAVLTWTIRSPEAEAEARRIADNVTFEGYLPAKRPTNPRTNPAVKS